MAKHKSSYERTESEVVEKIAEKLYQTDPQRWEHGRCSYELSFPQGTGSLTFTVEKPRNSEPILHIDGERHHVYDNLKSIANLYLKLEKYRTQKLEDERERQKIADLETILGKIR